MAAREDLTGLLLPQAGTEPYRQGVIVAFNPATGANQVRVGGATLVDLPILVGGDTVNFQHGDTVILLRYLSSWAILGRIVVPGNEALLSTAVDFFASRVRSDAPGGLGLSFDITNTYQTHSLISVPVPEWANSALVTATSWVLAGNGSGVNQLYRGKTLIDGEGPEVWWWMPTGSDFHSVLAPNVRTIAPGDLGATIEIQGQVRADGPTWVTGGNAGYVAASVIFRKVA